MDCKVVMFNYKEKTVSAGPFGSVLMPAATGRNSKEENFCFWINSQASLESQDLWVRTRQAVPPVQLPWWSPFRLHTSHPSLPGLLIPALDRTTLIMMVLTSGSLPHPSIDSGAVRVSPISLSDGSPLTVYWNWSYTPGASVSPR